MEEITIGIDLGTTNTLAAYMKNGKPKLLKFSGSDLLPSILYVDMDKSILVGKKAKQLRILDDANGIRSSKTYMGDFNKKWNCRGMNFTPTDVATEILREVKRNVIKKLKLDDTAVINAVITFPAYFDGNQTEETKKAGERAGLNVIRTINEPMAAAVFAIKEMDSSKKIFVVDLGGGTFDLSVLEADPANHEYNALDTDGDEKLGGDDFDEAMLQYLKDTIHDDIGVDLSSATKAGMEPGKYASVINTLREEAERVKIELSEETESEVDILNLFTYKGRNYNLSTSVTRKEFNKTCKSLYDRIFGTIESFLARLETEKHINLDDMGAVVLAGGSCEIPYIKEEIERRFNCQVNNELEKELLVVKGACMVAVTEKMGMSKVSDILSHSLGVEVYDNGKSMFSKIIERGTKYPCQMSKVYTTSNDYQDFIEAAIYEAAKGGEENLLLGSGRHKLYGTITLEGIEKAKAGIPKIEVTFKYDKNRCLTVHVEDKSTHASKEVRIDKGALPKNKPGKAQAPMDIVLLLDTSGSMSWGNAIKEAVKACKFLVNDLIDLSVHRTGFVSFDTSARVFSSLTNDKAKLNECIGKAYPSGGTYVVEGLNTAMSLFSSNESTRKKVIIMVTDGEPSDTPFGKLRDIRSGGTRVIVIGVGNGINEEQVRRLAPSSDDAYKISDMKQLQETFKSVMNKLTSV